MGSAPRAIYSIGAVAHMLGVSTATLRAWEERYGVVVPLRGDGAQRVYTREELEQLRYVKRQIDRGLSASDAHRLLQDELISGGLAGTIQPSGEPRPSLLIAERDRYAAELTEYFLRTDGYDVWTVLNASAARAIFDSDSPQLVILDLLISGGAGFRLCREFSDGGSAQVLAVAALDCAQEALINGASAFLQKPLESLQLVSTVRDLLRTSALTRPTYSSLDVEPRAGLRNEE